MLLNFLCTWLGVELLTLDCHGGTTEQDIISIFYKAKSMLLFRKQQVQDNEEEGDYTSSSSSSSSAVMSMGKTSASTVFIFLDEVNTCNNMGLLNEVMCHRTLNGERLPDGIQILAALNPYRLRSKSKDEAGLTFNLHGPVASTRPAHTSEDAKDNYTDIKNSSLQLVYRVQPIPPTFKDFIFDFGSLEPVTELLYISSMIKFSSGVQAIMATQTYSKGSNAPDSPQRLDEEHRMSVMIQTCQEYVRNVEGDASVVSLRDVKRCLTLFRWFYYELPDIYDAALENYKRSSGRSSEQSSSTSSYSWESDVNRVSYAFVLAVAHIYYYRLSTLSERSGLWAAVSDALEGPTIAKATKASKPLYTCFNHPELVELMITQAHMHMVSHLVIEDGISLNQAVTENLFVTLVCIFNKIPIFLVGKPGTSKTLTLQIIHSNLRGPVSAKVRYI